MKRFVNNSFFIILILITLLTSGIKITPVSAQTGGSMQIVPLSLPAGLTYGSLNGIWGSGPNDVYAVGYAFSGITLPFYFHKVNSDWIPFSPPLPSGWHSAALTSVWGSDANNVFIAGYGHNGTTTVPLVYNWNGSALTSTGLPLPAGWSIGSVWGIWGVSASEVYAMGSGINGGVTFPLLYRWNGSTWVTYTPALPAGWTSGTLYSAWGPSTNNVYAVGAGNNGGANWPMLYQWNGSTWNEANPALPLPSGWTSGTLSSIWGFAENNIYAVGTGYNGSVSVPLLHHWNGSVWSASSLPSMPTGVNVGYLTGIWGSSSSDIYAVGYGFLGTTKVPILYHKDSIGWNEASPVHPTGWTYDFLSGVWGSSFNDVYAVGTGHNGSVETPLLYHSSAVGQDLVAPGNVTNLAATTGTSSNSVKLTWNAPADDAGNTGSGSVASYLVKYSTSPFTSWADGIPITTGVPVPVAPGAPQTMTVSGLNSNTSYYFAVRAQDEQYNLSAEPVPTVSATSSGIIVSTWFISSTGNFLFGEGGDIPIPADYNGDGRADVAVYRPSNGTWYISTRGNFLYGIVNDLPVVGDYNGDRLDDLAVYRPSTGTWYISTLGIFHFGESGDVPVPGDYNGDGRDDFAVYRPSNGTWYISSRGNFHFGETGDLPVPGDYNGDRFDDMAVYRPSNGTWYISTRGNFHFGETGDLPVPGDYNGDGMVDMAVYRP